jgi:hypothetical protein
MEAYDFSSGGPPDARIRISPVKYLAVAHDR